MDGSPCCSPTYTTPPQLSDTTLCRRKRSLQKPATYVSLKHTRGRRMPSSNRRGRSAQFKPLVGREQRKIEVTREDSTVNWRRCHRSRCNPPDGSLDRISQAHFQHSFAQLLLRWPLAAPHVRWRLQASKPCGRCS